MATHHLSWPIENKAKSITLKPENREEERDSALTHIAETHEMGVWLSPALLLPRQHEAREAGTRGTRFRDRIKVGKGIISAFWGGEPEKKANRRPKYSSSNFLLDSGLRKTLEPVGPKLS